MKSAFINLPFIRIALYTEIEKGSLAGFADMPHHRKEVVSATDGTKTTLFFYVEKGDKPLDLFDKAFARNEVVRVFLNAIREADLLGDGVGEIVQINTEESLSDRSFFGHSPEEFAAIPKAKFSWTDNEGRHLANTMFKILGKLDAEPSHPAHVAFMIEHDGEEGEDVAMLCLPAVLGKRIKGDIYVGNAPEEAINPVPDMADTLSQLFMPENRVYQPESSTGGIHHPVTFRRGEHEYTAVLKFPCKEAPSWFTYETLKTIINYAIDDSLKTVNHLFAE